MRASTKLTGRRLPTEKVSTSRSKETLPKLSCYKRDTRAKNTYGQLPTPVLDPHCPSRTCYICLREGRNLQRIVALKYRHEDCSPGSPNWADYYSALDRKKRSDAGDLLLKHANNRRGA